MFYFIISLIFQGTNNQIIHFERGLYSEKYCLSSTNLIFSSLPTYGEEDFGNLDISKYTISFFVNVVQLLNCASCSYFLARIDQNNTVKLTIDARYVSTTQKIQYQIDNTLQLTFSSLNWYQVFIYKSQQKNFVKICDYLSCQQKQINSAIVPTKIYLYSYNGFNWCGQGYGMTLYKNIGLNNFMNLQNIMQPEMIIDLNIQEKIQSNITIDYSEYQFIVKLGDQFNWDQYDPYLVEDSLLFNSSQYIYIQDPQLKLIYTIEFRLSLSDTFTSNIVFLNYTVQSNYQLLIFIVQPMQLKIQINEKSVQYNFNQTEVIHIVVGIIHSLEQSKNVYSICLLIFDGNGILNYINDCENEEYYNTSKPFTSGSGDLFIGSNLNQFNQNEYFKLFHFRLYQGFYYDFDQIIDPKCKFYLNDRCIFCNQGFVLQVNHMCEPTCDSSQFLTAKIYSHNQCLRVCHPICATCTTQNPYVCLQCYGIRMLPPNCKCPPEYFDDGVQPNCRKYYQEIQTQTGFIDLQCTTSQQYLDIYYARTYNQKPSVSLIYIGAQSSQGFFSDIKIQIQGINTNRFGFYYTCTSFMYGQFQWVSSIGSNSFESIPFNLSNQNSPYTNISISPPQLLNNTLFTGFINIESFRLSQSLLQLSIDQQSEMQYSIQISIKMYGINVFQSNFVFYKYSNNSNALIQYNQIPKSIFTINLIQGMTSGSTNNFKIIQTQRNQNQIRLQNTYQGSQLQGILLFTTQQCYNQLDFCDFYESYVTSCSPQYSICKCNEIGYFLNSTNQCQSIYRCNLKGCNQNCITCIDLENKCTACAIDKHLADNNQCICQPGYFENGITCKLCDQNCRTCINLETKCTSCFEQQFIDTTNNSCKKCHNSCQTCTGLSINECLTCSMHRYLIDNNKCICQAGYYENNKTCELCEKRCLECSNYSQCTKCSKERSLNIQTNSCNCSEGQFDFMSYQCLNCHSTCKTCNNLQTCLSCFEGRILKDKKCVCAEGYYQDGQECLSCQNGKGVYHKECRLTNCKDGIWTPYEECDDNNYIIRDGFTNCKIDPGYYCLNSIDQESQCFKCQENCFNCSLLISQIKCNLCEEGYFLNQNNCVKCSKLCKTCQNNPNNCLTCIISQYQPDMNQKCQGCYDGYQVYQNKCISICGDGIKTAEENCDDGNLRTQDGCDQSCKLESEFHCDILNDLSICYKIQQPNILISKMTSMNSSSYFIQIVSLQIVNYNNISLYIKSDQVSGTEPFYFNYEMVQKINITIVFNESITQTNLKFLLEGDVLNNFNVQLEKNYVYQQFNNIMVLTDAQNKSSAKISSSASNQMILTLAINCMSIFLSGSAQLSTMVRVNNILSYIKFLDIKIPPNLMELLLQLEQFSLIKNVDIFQAYNSIQFGPQIEFEYIYPGKQFDKYNINANFTQNILPFILNLITGYLFVQVLLLRNLLVHKKKSIKWINSIFYKVLVFYQVYAQNQYANSNLEENNN